MTDNFSRPFENENSNDQTSTNSALDSVSIIGTTGATAVVRDESNANTNFELPVLTLSSNTVGEASGVDNKREIEGPVSGTKIVLQEAGGQKLILSTTDANSHIRHFEYGPHGELDLLRGPAGTWRRVGDSLWKGPAGQLWKGTMEVLESGCVVVKFENNDITVHTLDGKSHFRSANGGTYVANGNGQILETTDASNTKRSFSYDPQGNLIAFTEGNTTWSLSGENEWTSDDGRVWRGVAETFRNGMFLETDLHGNKTWFHLDGKREEANLRATQATCKNLFDARDLEIIKAALDGKTFNQRQEIKREFARLYGKRIEDAFERHLSPKDSIQAAAILNRSKEDDPAWRIKSLIDELNTHLLVQASRALHRSNTDIVRELIDVLDSMTAAELRLVNQSYVAQFKSTMSADLGHASSIAESSKRALRHFMQGSDQRTDQKDARLASEALRTGDHHLFCALMARAPETVRSNFVHADFEAAFGKSDGRIARDYASLGYLSEATQIALNYGFSGTSEAPIERVLLDMPPERRSWYANGRELRQMIEAAPTDAEREELCKRFETSIHTANALRFYDALHEQLARAAGSGLSDKTKVCELAKWEDMIVCPEGSLLAELAKAGDSLTCSPNYVFRSIEKMSQNDYRRLKTEPGFTEELEKVLGALLNEQDKQRAMEIIAKKRESTNFEESKQQKRDILTALTDVGRSDASQVLELISEMSEKERVEFSQNAKFAVLLMQRALQCVRSNIGNGQIFDGKPTQSPAEMLVERALSKIYGGQETDSRFQIIDKMLLHGLKNDLDYKALVSEIESALSKDPTLKTILRGDAQTFAEQRLLREFNQALDALGIEEDDLVVRALMSTGSIPIELKAQLHKSWYDDDEYGLFKQIHLVNNNDRARALGNREYFNSLFSYLSEEEQQVAHIALAQNGLRVEDELRSFVLGHGPDEARIKQLFADVQNPLNYQNVPQSSLPAVVKQRLDRIKQEYARKYGSDLMVDLHEHIGDDTRIATDCRSDRETSLMMIESANRARSGIGAQFTDLLWDGTGANVDDKVRQMIRTLRENPEELDSIVQKLHKAIELHKDSREDLANAIVDITIAAAGTVGSGGGSLALLVAAGVVAGAFKVATKSVLMGDGYGTEDFVIDAVTGFIDGFTTFIGSGAAAGAVNKCKGILRENVEQELKRDLTDLVKEAVANGGQFADNKLEALAVKYARNGNEVEQLTLQLKRGIEHEISERTRSFLVDLTVEVLQNSKQGAMGAAFAGGVESHMRGETGDEFINRVATSSMYGAIGGGAGTLVLKPTLHGASALLDGAENLVTRASNENSRDLNSGAAITEAKLRPGRDMNFEDSVTRGSGSRHNVDIRLPARLDASNRPRMTGSLNPEEVEAFRRGSNSTDRAELINARSQMETYLGPDVLDEWTPSSNALECRAWLCDEVELFNNGRFLEAYHNARAVAPTGTSAGDGEMLGNLRFINRMVEVRASDLSNPEVLQQQLQVLQSSYARTTTEVRYGSRELAYEIYQPCHVIVLSTGEKVDLCTDLKTTRVRISEQGKKELLDLQNSNAGQRLLAEHAMTAIEEMFHVHQFANRSAIISKVYADYLTCPDGCIFSPEVADDFLYSAGLGLSLDLRRVQQEQELLAALYEAGMPLENLARYYENSYSERTPMMQYLQRRELGSNLPELAEATTAEMLSRPITDEEEVSRLLDEWERNPELRPPMPRSSGIVLVRPNGEITRIPAPGSELSQTGNSAAATAATTAGRLRRPTTDRAEVLRLLAESDQNPELPLPPMPRGIVIKSRTGEITRIPAPGSESSQTGSSAATAAAVTAGGLKKPITDRAEVLRLLAESEQNPELPLPPMPRGIKLKSRTGEITRIPAPGSELSETARSAATAAAATAGGLRRPTTDRAEVLRLLAESDPELPLPPMPRGVTIRTLKGEVKRFPARSTASPPTEIGESAASPARISASDLPPPISDPANLGKILKERSKEQSSVPKSAPEPQKLDKTEPRLSAEDNGLHKPSDTNDYSLGRSSNEDWVVGVAYSACDQLEKEVRTADNPMQRITAVMGGLRREIDSRLKVTPDDSFLIETRRDFVRDELNMKLEVLRRVHESSEFVTGTESVYRERLVRRTIEENFIDNDIEILDVRAQEHIDGAGFDFVMINTKTGEFLPVDATFREKGDTICALRHRGIINNPTASANPKADVLVRLREIAADLKRNGSPMNLFDTPLGVLPEQHCDNRLRQVEALKYFAEQCKKAVEKLTASKDTAKATALTDYLRPRHRDQISLQGTIYYYEHRKK